MDIQDAERYCDEVMLARVFIRAAIDAEKLRRLRQRQEFFGAIDTPEGYDSKAADIDAALKPLAFVRFKDDRGREGMVQEPETWLRVCEHALRRFKAQFGEKAYETIHQRYTLRWTWVKIEEGQKKSHHIICMDRRHNFLHILTIYAVQAGLIAVE